ncbi:MAG: radical SAM protein [Steroidobacteraceae bacterium]|nr:radical SAM protein [Steroidobacteraceae bacterium]
MALNQFQIVYFEATRRCNLRCPSCMTGSNDPRKVRRRVRSEMTLAEIRDRVLVPARRVGVHTVGWSGGEFLLRKDALDLLRLTVEMDLGCSVLSNGKTLTRQRLEKIKDVTRGRAKIIVGLNALDEENRWSRDSDSDRSLQVLKDCAELGLGRHVVITIGKYNTQSFDKTIDYIVKNNISYNRSPLVARGSGANGFERLGFDRHDLEKYFHPALRRNPHGYVSYTPFFLSPELHAEASGGIRNNTVPENPAIGCWAGSWLAINAEGDVSVCPVLLDVLNGGNVRDFAIDELVERSALFADITDRSRLKGRCGRCRYQYTCGGCRAMAYFHTGDYLGEDPTCFFDPVDRSTVSEYEDETNRVFRKYLLVARAAGVYKPPVKRRREFL